MCLLPAVRRLTRTMLLLAVPAMGCSLLPPAANAASPPSAVSLKATKPAPDPVAVATARARQATATDGSRQRDLSLKRIERLKRIGKRSDAQRLMPLLKDADQQVRREAEQAIWLLWGRSGNPEIDQLFRAGLGAMGRGEIGGAIDTFTRIVDLFPDFAEAWNKRATARFVAGDLAGAMDDCERALMLLPNHFGSLAGYGHIYFRLDDLDMAIRYWQRALAVNPNLISVERSIEAAQKLLHRRGRLRT